MSLAIKHLSANEVGTWNEVARVEMKEDGAKLIDTKPFGQSFTVLDCIVDPMPLAGVTTVSSDRGYMVLRFPVKLNVYKSNIKIHTPVSSRQLFPYSCPWLVSCVSQMGDTSLKSRKSTKTIPRTDFIVPATYGWEGGRNTRKNKAAKKNAAARVKQKKAAKKKTAKKKKKAGKKGKKKGRKKTSPAQSGQEEEDGKDEEKEEDERRTAGPPALELGSDESSADEMDEDDDDDDDGDMFDGEDDDDDDDEIMELEDNDECPRTNSGADQAQAGNAFRDHRKTPCGP